MRAQLHGVKTPYGGVDEDGIDPWIPEEQIRQAKEDAKAKSRVASRKLQGIELVNELEKIKTELRHKIGNPRLPRAREKGSPKSPASPTPS